MAEIDSAPSLNAVSRDKKSASVRQTDDPTNFNPIGPRQKNLQFYDKKSASVQLRVSCTETYMYKRRSLTINGLASSLYLSR